MIEQCEKLVRDFFRRLADGDESLTEKYYAALSRTLINDALGYHLAEQTQIMLGRTPEHPGIYVPRGDDVMRTICDLRAALRSKNDLQLPFFETIEELEDFLADLDYAADNELAAECKSGPPVKTLFPSSLSNSVQLVTTTYTDGPTIIDGAMDILSAPAGAHIIASGNVKIEKVIGDIFIVSGGMVKIRTVTGSATVAAQGRVDIETVGTTACIYSKDSVRLGSAGSAKLLQDSKTAMDEYFRKEGSPENPDLLDGATIKKLRKDFHTIMSGAANKPYSILRLNELFLLALVCFAKNDDRNLKLIPDLREAFREVVGMEVTSWKEEWERDAVNGVFRPVERTYYDLSLRSIEKAAQCYGIRGWARRFKFPHSGPDKPNPDGSPVINFNLIEDRSNKWRIGPEITVSCGAKRFRAPHA